MQHLKTLLLVLVFSCAFHHVEAASPPPLNDTVCNAIDLGVLPVPGACPSYPYGDTVFVNGTTDYATYNSFDFPPVSCFGGVSPDVWYKFRATGSFIYMEVTGYGDLDSFFVKLHYSQGSCLSLVPLHCDLTHNGFMQTSFLTPDVGGEYYLQIGGSRYDETGNFSFSLKSYNECNGCVKDASLELSPAPWFGRYGTLDTVQMCVTVDHWEQNATSYIHGIVPIFGDEWDTLTLTPISTPGAGWYWTQDVPGPQGTHDGFFYDPDADGDPTNNAGDPGSVSTSWEACWSISTKAYCNFYDASIEVYIFSDNQTGTGNSTAVCQEYWPIHMAIAGWCCPAPVVTVQPTAACDSLATVQVDPVSPNAGDVFELVLYDDDMNVVTYVQGVTGTQSFTNIASGDYLLEVYNTNTTCVSFEQVHIRGRFEIDLHQTVMGCGPGTAQVVATPDGGMAPFTYNWQNISTFSGALAFNLNEGYVAVQVTDAAGCSAEDSIFVMVLPTPGAQFGYADVNYCHNRDTIQVWYDPFTPGGTYSLVAPLSTAITVDAASGTISLNNASVATPYYIYVQYSVGSACNVTYIDSVKIVQRPADPVATGATLVDWCISSTPPVLGVAMAAGVPSWYGVQTGQTGIGYIFTPTLGSATTPGLYYYVCTYFADLTFGCASTNFVTFTVGATQGPSFTLSPDVTICSGDSAQISVSGSGAYMYTWNPAPTIGPQNSASTSTAPSGTMTYTVDVTDGPCTSQGFVTVFIDSSVTCGTALYNGLTPNNDGHNDTWIIETAYNTTNTIVMIYNRWGQMVWHTNNYNNTSVVFEGRNGKGEELPSGTYFYTIQQENREAVKGWLELTR